MHTKRIKWNIICSLKKSYFLSTAFMFNSIIYSYRVQRSSGVSPPSCCKQCPVSIPTLGSAEPEWVNLLRSPGIDSQHGGPVRQSYLTYRSARLHRLAESIPWNQFLGSLNVYKFGLRRLLFPSYLQKKLQPSGDTQQINNDGCVLWYKK